VFDWLTALMYQPVPESLAVNFKELHVRRRAGGLGGSDHAAHNVKHQLTTDINMR